MPRPGRLLAGVSALLWLTGCAALQDATAPATPPSAAPTVASGAALSWAENLAFSGDLAGQLTSIVASAPGQASECTGRLSSGAGRWDSAIYGELSGGPVVGLIVTASPYRGPGTYTTGVTVEVHTPDNQKVWLGGPNDPVSFAVSADEESGSIDAVLTNQVNTTGKLHVAGTWACGR